MVLVNEETKGITRQGDPISSCLFLIFAEGLSALLRKAEVDRKLHGISNCMGDPKVSHLSFANDRALLPCYN